MVALSGPENIGGTRISRPSKRGSHRGLPLPLTACSRALLTQYGILPTAINCVSHSLRLCVSARDKIRGRLNFSQRRRDAEDL
ncbi:MAG: hypothetical protein DRI57_22985 [Deltaproteobacteria bacterium]|nr:MAG: hypothetical protein DRI57_22985 [Deltaproteobacteria bacterium]